MISYFYAIALQKAGFRRPRRFSTGQHWYTPEGRLGVVVNSSPDYVLMQYKTSTVAQFNFREFVYAPTVEEIITAIAKAGKHRLLTKQPGSKKFEVCGADLHQFVVGTRAANALAKEFVAISKRV